MTEPIDVLDYASSIIREMETTLGLPIPDAQDRGLRFHWQMHPQMHREFRRNAMDHKLAGFKMPSLTSTFPLSDPPPDELMGFPVETNPNMYPTRLRFGIYVEK